MTAKHDFAVIGKGLAVKDAVEKVTGALRYAVDLAVPGMLHGKILRSPYPHAAIKHIDASKAEAFPGVVGVATHRDAPDLNWQAPSSNYRGRILDGTARFVGDEIAAVAAVSERVAEAALGLIEVDYEILPSVFDAEEAMKPDAPQIREEGNVRPPCIVSWGDLKKGEDELDASPHASRRKSMLDLIIRNLRLPDGTKSDLAIASGRIVALGAGLVSQHPRTEIVDGRGHLALPGLVDGHMHIDKTLLGLPWMPHPAGPERRSRIETERRLRPSLALSVRERASNLVRRCITHGTTAIRTHVDVDPDIRLEHLHEIFAVRERFADRMDIQIVAFPQSGVITQPGTANLLEAALREGADGYARIRGGPSVVLGAQSGPGAVNLVTGIVHANLAYSPVVAIAGMVPRSHCGKDVFQELDQQALFAPICKRSFVVPSAERLPEMLSEALRLAVAGRPGPVVLNVPRDLFAESVSIGASLGKLPHCEGAAPQAEQIEEILVLLEGASAPVILAGGGIKWGRGGAALDALATYLDIPVAASAGHGDVLPGDHPLFAGQIGPRGNPVASRLTREADLVIALGTRMGFNSTFFSHDHMTSSGKIVQVDIDPAAIGRYFPISSGIAADATATAKALLEAAKGRGLSGAAWESSRSRFQDERQALLAERAAEAADAAMPLSPLRVFGELREALPRSAIVTIDTGAMALQAADRLRHDQLPGLLTPLDFGLVGFGYAAALGAAVAAPERPVVSIIGDGGFGMTMIEVTTAVQHKIPAVALILDNEAWAAEKSYQRDFFGGRFIGADLQNPRYDKFAEDCGARGYAVNEPGETAAALRDAIATKEPAVIHAKVDPDAFSSLRRDLFGSTRESQEAVKAD